MRKIGNIKSLLREFRGYLTLERGLSAHTADSYEFDLQKLLPFLEQEHIGLAEVTYRNLETFAATLFDLGIADATRKRILAGVKSFFHFLKTEGFIEEDPSLLLGRRDRRPHKRHRPDGGRGHTQPRHNRDTLWMRHACQRACQPGVLAAYAQ